MSDASRKAVNFFNENLGTISAVVNPKEYNLYAGLMHLAEAIQDLEQEIHQIRRAVKLEKDPC